MTIEPRPAVAAAATLSAAPPGGGAIRLLGQALKETAAEDRYLLLVALGYAGAALAVLAWYFDGGVADALHVLPMTLVGCLMTVAAVAGFAAIGFLARHRPAAPIAAILRAAAAYHTWPPLACRALLIVPTAALLMVTFGAMKAEIPFFRPFAFDGAFVALDAALHGGVQPWALLQPVLGSPLATALLDRAYYFWFPVMFITFYWQVFTFRMPALRLQFLLAFVACWAVVGTIGAIAFSSAGPAFLDELGHDVSPYQGLFAYLEGLEAKGQVLLSQNVQDMLWAAHANGVDMPFEGISAMPSMHVAIVFLLALLGWRRHWLAGLGYTLFAVLIFVGSIHLGFHYAVDGYAAAVIVALLWWGAGAVARRRYPAEPADGSVRAASK
jgi:hypothetical protein